MDGDAAQIEYVVRVLAESDLGLPGMPPCHLIAGRRRREAAVEMLSRASSLSHESDGYQLAIRDPAHALVTFYVTFYVTFQHLSLDAAARLLGCTARSGCLSCYR